MKIGIAGAGLVGRLLAWHLCQRDVEVHLFSKESMNSEQACGLIAAGMISPYAELLHLPHSWFTLGLRSLYWWPKILASLSTSIFYQNKGTIVVCPPQQKALLQHFIKTINKNQNFSWKILNTDELKKIEPEISDLIGCYLPDEAQIDPVQLFGALTHTLLQNGVHWHPYHHVIEMSATGIETDKGYYPVDKTIDCRGLGAKASLSQLRGVRGELILCTAPEVKLQHAIRLLHPRMPCYIVPRSERYVIGATHIESESMAPITIQSALSLLSAAVSVHSGFYDAHIVELKVGCRPTTPSHTPLVVEHDGVIRINGLYRHGYLLAPALTEKVSLALNDYY